MGFMALGLLIAGGVGTVVALTGGDTSWWSGVTLRSGAILGSFWLVLPKARDVPVPVWTALAVFAGFLAIRPRLVLFGLVAAFVAMIAVAVAQRRATSSK